MKVAGHQGASQLCLEVSAAPVLQPWPSGHASAALAALQLNRTSSKCVAPMWVCVCVRVCARASERAKSRETE